ncbi:MULTISPECIES: DUF3290 domain-containing protein [Enterococcus]|uniref:DUF3290 domain-containing protein n=1 Tax=Enterococcus TaxID=1350 RepID=UPI001A8CF7E9|nr:MULTISPECIES: DUF3290 domain-containing protein [Enterococcus]MBO0422827.1 DUF3290 domain-containing protein [Enterococcus plantarum]MBO0447728.1 DUF3290 domain-containing protein [Enterococcus ureilyticus]
MNFYGIDYLESQSNLNDYIKYFFIFGALIVMIIAFSLYMRHRIQTKYRDLSIITFLLLLFLLGVQYSDYTQNQSKNSQSSQMVNFVKQISKEKGVDKKEILVSSTQLVDGTLVKIEDKYYKTILSTDQNSYVLEEAHLMNSDIIITK